MTCTKECDAAYASWKNEWKAWDKAVAARAAWLKAHKKCDEVKA